eukprot:TRINITY_DN61897_c0_g1_i1.p1 TRINITY_DN61897_c0_g1~~TRINITY_DN61897_c0_g1_i1.p1  ORF type:complete len:692 (+),score=-47.35 TRINITY_DN61897_c0_g1_i1:347-2422(+)
MAIITKIREKAGWTAGVIAVTLGLFIVGTDLFSGNSSLLSNDQVVGEIDGTDVKLQDFATAVDRLVNNYRASAGRAPSDAQMPGIRNQAWQQFIERIAYEKEYSTLGIEVTTAEIEDMIKGNNIHPGIAQAFKNPETGEVDRNQIEAFLYRIQQGQIDGTTFTNFEKQLYPERKKQKYEGLLTLSSYATKHEAKREYDMQNTKFDFKYAYIPYSSIADSLVEFEDSDLRNYYEDNKSKYEKDANRAIEYVSFSIKPTTEDENDIRKDLAELIPLFTKTTNDTTFVEANSSNTNNFKAARPNQLPQAIDPATIEVGKVYGPVKEGKVFKLYKLVSIGEDTVFSARASHILFKEDNKSKAQEILREIRRGADFAAMAKEHGTDGTKNRGGDLGWFAEGAMVTEFNDAVMGATNKGVLPRLVKTQFGYHIIEITELKTKKLFNLATIEKEITYSDATYEVAYSKAGRFAQVKDRKEYDAKVTQDSLTSIQALNIAPNSRYVNNLSDPSVRNLVRWAYNDDTEIGDVSELVELNDQFIIAVLRGKREKGIAPFEDVKKEVEREVKKDIQKKIILEQLKGTDGLIDAVVKNFGNGASMNTLEDRSASNPSIPKAGYAPNAFGRLLSMKAGEKSEPIEERNGIIILELTAKEDALETADYTVYQTQLQDKESRSVTSRVKKAIEEYAGVEDMIYKHY